MKTRLVSGALTHLLSCMLVLAAGSAAFAQAAPEPSAAAVEAEAVPPRAVSAPSQQELNSLLAQTELSEAATSDGPTLQLYGFVDFTLSGFASQSQVKIVYQPAPSFAIGNLNLYAAADLTHGWRSLFELRFLYLPGGDVDFDKLEYKSNSAIDYADQYRPLRWGAIEIERAYLEYELHSLLTIRAGQWLTPFGIWNVDHGTPAIIPVNRPYSIGDGLFPERQTGLDLYGSVLLGESTIGYHLTLSNGRGSADEYRDLDKNKALGGRLYVTLMPLGTLTLGVSGYKGRSTEAGLKVQLEPVISVQQDVRVQYDEVAYAADVLWEWRGLHLQAELLVQEYAFTEGGRPGSVGITAAYFPAPGRLPDTRRVGGYVLLGYRLPWFPLMPFLLLEQMNYGNKAGNGLEFASGAGRDLDSLTAGLNYRPIPAVVLKAEISHTTIADAHLKMTALAAQAAWSF